MKVGFTGTQSGMTQSQNRSFITLVRRLVPSQFHHGLCVGSDEQAHHIVREQRPTCRIVGHPPTDDKKQAKDCFCDELRDPKPYLDRNEDIARETNVVIATPKESAETVRSGTWATVRRARKAKTTILIIWPDGSITKETSPSATGHGLPTEDENGAHT